MISFCQVRLTTDHKASVPEEQRRVLAAGGHVENYGDYRISNLSNVLPRVVPSLCVCVYLCVCLTTAHRFSNHDFVSSLDPDPAYS